ncbi:MAG: HAD family hydrolase [Clostridiales bacterium]|nr:HAD family hydrolase [Clostridiales bacterium]
MEPKLIFLDIDGTLTEPGKNVPPDSALEAIRKAQAIGNRVFLCTGRNMAMVQPLLHYGFDGVVASAGGYVTCGDQVLYDHPMPEADVADAMELFKKNGVYRTLECLDATYTDSGLGDFLSGTEGVEANSELIRWREACSKNLGMLPMEEFAGQPVYKIVLMCNTSAQLLPARARLEQDYLFCMQDMGAQGFLNGELIHRDFDKGTGIRRVCETLHVPPCHTYGFGDSMNDLEMFRAVGISICMENGGPLPKKMATSVCRAVTDDGLYHAFETLKLF